MSKWKKTQFFTCGPAAAPSLRNNSLPLTLIPGILSFLPTAASLNELRRPILDASRPETALPNIHPINALDAVNPCITPV